MIKNLILGAIAAALIVVGIVTVMDVAKSGAWQVIKNIILQLKEIDHQNQYVIFVEATYEDDFGVLPENWQIVRSSVTAAQPLKNIIWHGFVLPFLLICGMSLKIVQLVLFPSVHCTQSLQDRYCPAYI